MTAPPLSACRPWRWRLLRAGALRLDGGGMFGVVPRTLWSRLVSPDEQNRIPLQTNCLLLEDGETRVLIETGFGEKWSDRERGFYDLERRCVADALREIDVDPASIDDVFVTHLHFDHAAGLTRLGTDGAPEAVFRRARIHVQQVEWDDACANKAVMTRTYLRSHLVPIAGQVETHHGAAEPVPGVAVMPAPGHTWGQQVVIFRDQDGVVCFPGDVCPTLHHAGAAFSMAYDVEPYTAMLTKQGLLGRAEGEGWRIVLDHEPGDPIVRVERVEDRFVLRQAT